MAKRVDRALLDRQPTDAQAAVDPATGALEPAGELEQQREAFITSVSHDLRTPLTAVRAGLGLLQASADTRLSVYEQRLLTSVRRNVERLNMSVDDLLAYNQLHADALVLECEALDLRGVVTEAMATVYPLLCEKQQTLELNLPVDLPVWGDARRLEHVLINLLANAHRHTPPGTRVVLVGEQVHNVVHVLVRDNGPGVPTREVERIFDRFYRLNDGVKGSGLGLAIARDIIVRHNGRIWAESTEQEGFAIHLILPVAPTHEAPPC